MDFFLNTLDISAAPKALDKALNGFKVNMGGGGTKGTGGGGGYKPEGMGTGGGGGRKPEAPVYGGSTGG